MSRQNKRIRASQAPPVQQPRPEKAVSRRRIFIAAVAALVLAFVVGILLYKGAQTRAAQQKPRRTGSAIGFSRSCSIPLQARAKSGKRAGYYRAIERRARAVGR